MTNILNKIVEEVKSRNQINQRFDEWINEYNLLRNNLKNNLKNLLNQLNRSGPVISIERNQGKLKDFFLITECKKGSPSKGIIRENYRPSEIAREYVRGGSSAISVLVEEDFFYGGEDHFREVRKAVKVPMLWKDFVVDLNQVLRAYQAGADMVLLIVRILNPAEYIKLVNLITDLGMTPLVEVFNLEEVEQAIALPIELQSKILLGVNNRDLTNFRVDLNQSLKVKDFLAEKSIEIPLISESGIVSSKEIKFLIEHGFSGALVGESLLRQPDVCDAVNKLLGKE